MECHKCLGGDARLAKLTYGNGDPHEMYLCGNCIRYFGADDEVREIVSMQKI